MKTILVFDCVVQDSVIFKAGECISAGTTYKLFTPDDNGIEDKITNEGEEQILKKFMSSRGKQILFEKLGFSQNAFFDFSVKEPIVKNPHHSDIDLVICEPELPQFAVGIQCKRVKVESLNDSQDDFNRLSDVKHGVVQANKQRENYGFHRNYLLIISEVFGRNFTKENTLFRGARKETKQQIYEFPQRESLHEDVGIIFVEVVQPTGESFNKLVKICVCVDKEAAMLDQNSGLTNRMKELIR